MTSERDREFHELMQRPDIDQAYARYEELIGKTQKILSDTFPRLNWHLYDPPSSAACGHDFNAVNQDSPTTDDAETKSLGGWTAAGGVTGEQWHQAIAAITPLLQSYGFKAVFHVDGPKDYQIDFYDEYDADFSFGSMLDTSMRITTGCHLTAEVKRRGTPSIPPSY
jgi:Lipoprotein confined to pathogenic Mycobacterium